MRTLPGWCAAAGVASIIDVEPLHIAAWIEAQTRKLSAPTVKQPGRSGTHLPDVHGSELGNRRATLALLPDLPIT